MFCLRISVLVTTDITGGVPTSFQSVLDFLVLCDTYMLNTPVSSSRAHQLVFVIVCRSDSFHVYFIHSVSVVLKYILTCLSAVYTLMFFPLLLLLLLIITPRPSCFGSQLKFTSNVFPFSRTVYVV